MQHWCVIHALVPSDCGCFDMNRSPTQVNSKGTRMLKRKLRKTSTDTPAANRGHGLRHITGRKIGMIVLALATSLTGVAIIAPQASAVTQPCVGQTFGIWDENTYEHCVRDEQVLLNDLWISHAGGNQLLTVDGYYGPHTASDVRAFQYQFDLIIDGITGDQTWGALCVEDEIEGFTGVYWHDAGCFLV
jgi:peptidoglycan hydrolase-like protein with peptidoglycan-binding domain